MRNSASKSNGPPRVMHVITPSHVAGAETFLIRLFRRADCTRAVHHCVTKPSAANEQMRSAGIDLEELNIGGKANFLAIARLARAARRFNADLLHSHLSSASWWCGWLERFGGPPSIGHVHGFTSRLWHLRQKHLIACSGAVKQQLIDKGFAAERITVMHYPVDPNDLVPTRSAAEVRAELGAEPDTPVIATFAHLSIKKGYRELVRSAALVLKRMPNAQFWCCGEGALRDELTLAAKEFGIERQFKLCGFRRDVANLMPAIDVMCLPSHREPFGLVYVEAALAGKPVIACNAGGAPEIIVDGETGLLVPAPTRTDRKAESDAPNIVPLAEAILTLLTNRDRAATMGRRGREQALERFSWSGYLARLHELYEQIRDDRPVDGGTVTRRAA